MLGKCKYFTSLDLKSGYWQFAMNEHDKEKTDFVCHRGLFGFNVMPFGLSNAPAFFKNLCLLFRKDVIDLQILTQMTLQFSVQLWKNICNILKSYLVSLESII